MRSGLETQAAFVPEAMANVKITIDGKGVDKPFLVLQLKSYY
jgi:hypothetical protein